MPKYGFSLILDAEDIEVVDELFKVIADNLTHPKLIKCYMTPVMVQEDKDADKTGDANQDTRGVPQETVPLSGTVLLLEDKSNTTVTIDNDEGDTYSVCRD